MLLFRFLILPWILLTSLNTWSQDYRIVSFNLRYDNPNDPYVWQDRKGEIAKTIIANEIGIAGFQEVLHHQLMQLDSLLPDYAQVGVGRDDGKTKGEYVPIFYRKDRFTLLETGTFWLSANPTDTGSISWDAALPRICTWATFYDTQLDHNLLFLNTHFDHVGETARLESAKVILEFMQQAPSDYGIILTGDFNAQPHEAPIQELDYFLYRGGRETSNDSKLKSSFNHWGKSNQPLLIDYIFHSPHFEASHDAILSSIQQELILSDHDAILLHLNWK